jgi:hypothetical protein
LGRDVSINGRVEDSISIKSKEYITSNQINKQRDMTNTKEFIQEELKSLMHRGFVATPESADELEAFARANGGSMDIILMQMAVQYGAKLAYENILENMPE